MKRLIHFLASPAGCGLTVVMVSLCLRASAASFDSAPFGLPLPEGNGVMWEDPREVHRVVVHFQDAPPAADKVRLEYWGSWWPGRHLPKDREPGGADTGWMELGNWHKYEWRAADAEAKADGHSLTFTFRPVNAKEFPKVENYPATFRYTLKVRVASDAPRPAVSKIEAFTDSTLEPRAARLAWAKPLPVFDWRTDVFNGELESVEKVTDSVHRVRLRAVVNADPNTFDRTLVTLRRGEQVFTFKFDDLASGPLFLPHLGVAVLPESDTRDYAAVAAEVKARGTKTLYERVAERPEQTWQGAWDGMPRKKSDIYFVLGLDGGRQRFRLNADGSIEFRSNDHYLKNRPGKDTPRLELEKPNVNVRFVLPGKPAHRTLQEEALPVCTTTWNTNGVQVKQTAFATALDGTRADGPVPPGDAFTVFMTRFTITNTTSEPRDFALPIVYRVSGQRTPLQVDADGFLWAEDKTRGQVLPPPHPSPLPSEGRGGNRSRLVREQARRSDEGVEGAPSPVGRERAGVRVLATSREAVAAHSGSPADARRPIDLKWTLAPNESRAVTLKVPYPILTEAAEREALKKLDFDTERRAVAGYWRRRVNESASLITPEPMLNEFYRSHAMHLLVNCEREPGSDRRFARVGSFGYGAYGNESCMMVVDLDRRGYHQEAQDCLDAWLHYQSTVALPGTFESKEGVLYGAGGYEAGGYNQHHGWILWCLGEHFRSTRDTNWLRQAAPGIVKGADWIIRETARTATRHELERGLLPAGSLEDIGDWWTWLSTSCYSWRGLDTAAWALEQLQHPDAARVRQAAGEYHRALLTNFRKASELSPVVRLRDGTAIPQIPSHVHRRGRTFGWICETLEGALHLLITRALDPKSQLAEWILKDYEDNLYLSNQYGYTVDDFEKHWFGRGGISMQACLLFQVEPYLYRDEPKHALRGLFNAQAASYFPDVRMNTEHAAPFYDGWRGDHFKSSDEANCTGWLRHLFVREENADTLLIGQAIPREWLRPGQHCGMEKAVTWFGPVSVLFTGGDKEITCQLKGPRRNPPKEIRLRFRHPESRPLVGVTVNGAAWKQFDGEWVTLPGDVGVATVAAKFGSSPTNR
ncbi:MAG: hypothetical protein HZA90_17805 [Verrucomicrobia bacterium]|nr:hypothetical protein [Verrucomicrobiota bacterium]